MNTSRVGMALGSVMLGAAAVTAMSGVPSASAASSGDAGRDYQVAVRTQQTNGSPTTGSEPDGSQPIGLQPIGLQRYGSSTDAAQITASQLVDAHAEGESSTVGFSIILVGAGFILVAGIGLAVWGSRSGIND